MILLVIDLQRLLPNQNQICQILDAAPSGQYE